VSGALSATRGGKNGKAASCSRAECDRDYDSDEDIAVNKKKWNCYTVFVKETLRDLHLTKVGACL